MRRPILSVMWLLALFFGPVAPTAAQTYSNLYEFSGPDGRHPVGSLIQAAGGANGVGTLFRLDAEQTPAALTVLHHFGDPSVASDGANPVSALILGPDDRLYGTTPKGGAHDWGTVFAIAPSGYEVLFSFGSENFEPGPCSKARIPLDTYPSRGSLPCVIVAAGE